MQNLASIPPRTSLVKFARSPRTDYRSRLIIIITDPSGVLQMRRRASSRSDCESDGCTDIVADTRADIFAVTTTDNGTTTDIIGRVDDKESLQRNVL